MASDVESVFVLVSMMGLYLMDATSAIIGEAG